MERRILGKTGLQVSPLGFGGAPVGFLETEQKAVATILNELLDQGVNLSIKKNPSVDFYLFTDADINHSQETLKIMVTKAERENLQLVSLMVLLNCRNFWEILLIPAFVFFFQKLYPFQWINNPKRSTAGAAGGYILVRRTALEAAGGIDAVHGEIIDDCAIGRMIKKNGSICLVLTRNVKSLRSYTRLSEI